MAMGGTRTRVKYPTMTEDEVTDFSISSEMDVCTKGKNKKEGDEAEK